MQIKLFSSVQDHYFLLTKRLKSQWKRGYMVLPILIPAPPTILLHTIIFPLYHPCRSSHMRIPYIKTPFLVLLLSEFIMLYLASDLFEVVDRRAKLVVNELSDEQLASQSLGINFELCWLLLYAFFVFASFESLQYVLSKGSSNQ